MSSAASLPASLPAIVFEPSQVGWFSYVLLDDGARHCSLITKALAQVSLEWATDVGARLEQGSWEGYGALQTILPAETAVQILEAATTLLKQEPTVVDVRPPPSAPAPASWQQPCTSSGSCQACACRWRRQSQAQR